jgi:outer membrane protein assembly factor BamB
MVEQLVTGAVSRWFSPGRILTVAVVLLLVAGCGSDEPILPGERFPVRPQTAEPAAEAAAVQPLALPRPVVNAEWSHRNGTSSGRLDPPPAFSAGPQRIWTVSIGSGSARRSRLLAGPIVAGGAVFTLDAAGQLSAVTPQGQAAWRASLVPEGQAADSGPGGGMAFDSGRLFVTTGFGEVFAIDPASGGILWRTEVDAPVRAAPTVLDGRVFAVARNDTAYAFDAATGQLLWRVQGAGGGAGVLGGSTAAARGPLVVVPFSSGEVLAILARNGQQIWGTAVTGGRRELVRNRINDISGDPVFDGDVVYASNQSGRTVAVDSRSGERIWTISEGSYGPAWPAGGALFMVSDLAELVRVDALDGRIVWEVQLPQYRNERRRLNAIGHYGPILAGGRLWVASGDGVLRGFQPDNGNLVYETDLPGGAAAAPAVAKGVMYIVTQDGRLHAFQ